MTRNSIRVPSWLAAAALSALGGCATLQIDVDVYKGPLVNNDEIQQQQMISMAMAAKTLMISFRNERLVEALGVGETAAYRTCLAGLFDRRFLVAQKLVVEKPELVGKPETQSPTALEKHSKLQQAIQLNALLAFYYDMPHSARGADEDTVMVAADLQLPPVKCNTLTGNERGYAGGRQTQGIETLATALLMAEENFKRVPHGQAEHLEVVEARREIEVALVDLAARMQFLATNQWLIGSGGEGTEQLKSLLEAIANTILVHADDIQNRRRFEMRAIDSSLTEEIASGKLTQQGSDAILDRIDATFNEYRLDAVDATSAIQERERNPRRTKENARPPDPPLPQLIKIAASRAPVSKVALSKEDWDNAITLIRALRGTVVARINSGTCEAAFMPLLDCYRTLLQGDASPAKDVDNAKFALDIVSANRTPKRDGAFARSATDVMDKVITTLRYQHIDALAKGATNAANIANALTEARKQRSDMIYLRPSSAYLRSVFATTATQEDPRLGWQNLLNDQMGNMINRVRSKDGEKERLKETRAELDKAFWQNINTVRVNGASGTNFVVAKDDVGNWYVKSMGADPTAMVKAAKNLALYNLGGSLNTNLLRVSQLRETTADASITEPQRTLAQNELNDMLKGNSGPAVGARSQTLALFEDNYQRQSDAQKADLAARIGRDGFAADLKARWDATMKSAPAKDARLALDQAFAHPSVVEAAGQATAASTRLPADISSANAILEMLEALSRYQSALKAQVGATGAMVSTESTAASTAAGTLLAAESAVGTGLAGLTAAEKDLQSAEADNAANSTTASVDALARRRLQYTTARGEVERRTLALTARRDEAAAANATLAAALARRDNAMTDVDAVIRQSVLSIAGKRIRAVEQMEMAVKVVGQSGQKQTSATGAKP